MGLGKNQQGLPEFVERGVPRLKHGIGYGKKDGFDAKLDIWDQLEKEEKIEAKKGTLEATFAREGTTYPYKGTLELILMAGEIIFGFKIFADYVNGVKKTNVIEISVGVEELIVAEEEPKEDVATPEVKTADDQDGELDLKTYVLNSIMDVFYDDFDVFFTTLFDSG